MSPRSRTLVRPPDVDHGHGECEAAVALYRALRRRQHRRARVAPRPLDQQQTEHLPLLPARQLLLPIAAAAAAAAADAAQVRRPKCAHLGP